MAKGCRAFLGKKGDDMPDPELGFNYWKDIDDFLKQPQGYAKYCYSHDKWLCDNKGEKYFLWIM